MAGRWVDRRAGACPFPPPRTVSPHRIPPQGPWAGARPRWYVPGRTLRMPSRHAAFHRLFLSSSASCRLAAASSHTCLPPPAPLFTCLLLLSLHTGLHLFYLHTAHCHTSATLHYCPLRRLHSLHTTPLHTLPAACLFAHCCILPAHAAHTACLFLVIVSQSL